MTGFDKPDARRCAMEQVASATKTSPRQAYGAAVATTGEV